MKVEIDLTPNEYIHFMKQVKQMGFWDMKAMIKYCLYSYTGLKSQYSTGKGGKWIKGYLIYKIEEFFKPEAGIPRIFIREILPKLMRGIPIIKKLKKMKV